MSRCPRPLLRAGTWKLERNRQFVSCTGTETVAEEIVSPIYVQALERLNAVIRVMVS